MAKTKKAAAVVAATEFADKTGFVLAVGDQVRYEHPTSQHSGRLGIITAIHLRENRDSIDIATVEFLYDSHWQAAPAMTAGSDNLTFVERPDFVVGERARVAWAETDNYASRDHAYTGQEGEVVRIFLNTPFPDLVLLEFANNTLEECEFMATDLLRTALAGPVAEAVAVPEPAPVATEQPTAPALVQEIALADIDTSRNYRQVFDEADLVDLATSIKAHGVMQPVLVRPTPVTAPVLAVPYEFVADQYELVYGGRRYKASTLAGLATIPATVRQLTDLAFAEMQLVENVQRKDVRPSDEARAFHDLLNKHKLSAEELSHKVGRPVKFVLQRAKLVALVPFWMEALEQERLPLVAAHEIARLPEQSQAQLEGVARRNYDTNKPDAVFTAHWIRTCISQYVLADLNAAFFRKNDATLFPKAGACTACPKRSGACQGLFDEVESKHDYCLDKPCFEQKKTNLVERHKQELRKQTGKKPVLISCTYYQVPAGVFDCYRYKDAKQEDAGAVQAVMIDGAEMGRIKWVVLKGDATGTASSKDKEADAARLRKERLTKTHRALIAEKLTADLPAAVATQGPVYESILTWLLLEECGSSKSTLAYLGDSWGWEPSEADIRNDYNDKDERGFRPWQRFVLRMIGPLSLKQRMELYLALKVRHRMDYDYEDRQFTVAKLVNGLGYPELEAEAAQAVERRYYTKKGAKK